MPYKDPEKQREYNARPDVKKRKRERDREYRANPETKAKQREYHRERNAKPEQQARNREIWDLRNYGITREEMVELLGSDDCGICGANTFKAGASDKRNPIDHCAETSIPGSITVRGFLCDHCNRGLGMFSHQTDRLQKAIRYLENPPLVPPDRYARMLKTARAK